MMYSRIWYFIPYILITLVACHSQKPKTKNEELTKPVYESESLIIRPISKHCFVHTSFLSSRSFSNVPCNGLVYFDSDTALVIDTPVDEASSELLIDWIVNTKKASIKAVVPSHFHVDCLGGLPAFHRKDIPSFAHEKTITLAHQDSTHIPKKSIKDQWICTIGKQNVVFKYFGEGHTRDNIVAYLPEEKVLFGGCLIKAVGAGKGNLKDANVAAWPETVAKLKHHFSEAEIVVPGHGDVGGQDLLDYTIKKFSDL